MNQRALLDKAKFKYDHAVQAVEDETVRLEEVSKSLVHHKQAVEIVQLVAQSVEQAVHSKIANVVTRCLEAVFDDAYHLVIEFTRKRNRTEAVIQFERNGMLVDPMSASGGGVVDVAAFALRVACLTLQKDLEQVLVLDEPFKFLSKEYRPRVRQLLETLSQELGVQILMITHLDVLRTGKVIEMGS